ncbi:MAG: hypothetical protein L3K14_02740 [Thermoplasmata archaeon]|nr:hypothetical protein [Thermoplasmata archaeon]
MATGASRLRTAWNRRKSALLWAAVGVAAVLLAALIGARLLQGASSAPRHFSFSFTPPSCGCSKLTQTTYAFPARATVDFSWWVTWTGSNASVQLTVAESDGTLVYEALSEYQQGNPFNPNVTWGQGGAGTFPGYGSPFTFAISVISLAYFLPPNTSVWVNGTYTTPLL